MRVGRLLLATGFCSILVAGSSQAAAPTASAYWWIAETGTAAVPAPSTVPAGGLYVASSASGPTAVSAVRFTLPTDQANAQLVVRVHQLQRGYTFAVDACTTGATWSAGSSQPWSGRPTCDAKATPVHGVLSADGKTVTFGLTATLPGQTANLVLVPGSAVPAAAGAPAAPSPTFDASFEPLDATSVVSTKVEQPGATTSVPPFTDEPAVVPPVSDAAPPAMFGPLVPTTPAAAPAPVEAPAVVSPVAQPVPAGAVVSTRPAGRSTRDNALLLFLLGGAMFYLGWLARSQTSSTGRTSIYDLPPVEQDG